jgi:SAM-dependent methyltransferase
VYDLLYSYKNYAKESTRLHKLISRKCKSKGDRVLEVACGTGTYIKCLKRRYDIDGFDLSVQQVEVAKRKNPTNRIIQANMLNFDMKTKYDTVLCLFSSIGYLKTKSSLNVAVQNMAKHLKPGGLLIIEAWLQDYDLIPGYISLETAEGKDLSLMRMGKLEKRGDISIVNMNYMIGTKKGIEHYEERHELALYTDADFREAFKRAGLISFEVNKKILNRRTLIGSVPT